MQILRGYTQAELEDLASDAAYEMAVLDSIKSEKDRERLRAAIAQQRKGKAPAQAEQPAQAAIQVNCRGC